MEIFLCNKLTKRLYKHCLSHEPPPPTLTFFACVVSLRPFCGKLQLLSGIDIYATNQWTIFAWWFWTVSLNNISLVFTVLFRRFVQACPTSFVSGISQLIHRHLMFSSSGFMRNIFDWWLVIFVLLANSLICNKWPLRFCMAPEVSGRDKRNHIWLHTFDQGITKKHREETGKDKTKHEGNSKSQSKKSKESRKPNILAQTLLQVLRFSPKNQKLGCRAHESVVDVPAVHHWPVMHTSQSLAQWLLGYPPTINPNNMTLIRNRLWLTE